jgi:hypothetical protein
LRIESIAAAGAEPVGVSNSQIASGLARPAPRPVVLQSAIDVIRPAHIDRNRVELSGDDAGVDEFPRVALIVSDVESPVVTDHDVLAVFRIDPDCMVIAVGNAGLQRLESFAAIN